MRQRGANVVDDRGAAQLESGHVDAEREVLELGEVVPGCDLGTCVGENDPAERQDQPGVLGEGDELPRGEKSTGWMVPPGERFDTDDAARADGHRGLVVDLDLAGRDSGAQFCFGCQALLGVVEHALLEQVEAGLAGVFGRVQRDVGVTEQVSGCVAGSGERSSGGRSEQQRPACSEDRLLERDGEPAGDRVDVVGRDVRDDDRELVASETADQVVRAERGAETLTDSDQHPIAGGMPEPVVDRFEPVEVQHHDPHCPHRRVIEGCREAPFEQGAVRESGERVVKRLELELVDRALQPIGHLVQCVGDIMELTVTGDLHSFAQPASADLREARFELAQRAVRGQPQPPRHPRGDHHSSAQRDQQHPPGAMEPTAVAGHVIAACGLQGQQLAIRGVDQLMDAIQGRRVEVTGRRRDPRPEDRLCFAPDRIGTNRHHLFLLVIERERLGEPAIELEHDRAQLVAKALLVIVRAEADLDQCVAQLDLQSTDGFPARSRSHRGCRPDRESVPDPPTPRSPRPGTE